MPYMLFSIPFRIRVSVAHLLYDLYYSNLKCFPLHSEAGQDILYDIIRAGTFWPDRKRTPVHQCLHHQFNGVKIRIMDSADIPAAEGKQGNFTRRYRSASWPFHIHRRVSNSKKSSPDGIKSRDGLLVRRRADRGQIALSLGKLQRLRRKLFRSGAENGLSSGRKSRNDDIVVSLS